MAVANCTFYLRDPLNRLWAVGVQDDGQLTTTLTILIFHIVDPIIQASGTVGLGPQWTLTADLFGRIVATQTPSVPEVPTFYVLVSPGGLVYFTTLDTVSTKLVTAFQPGVTATQCCGPLTQPPRPLDVTMSNFAQVPPPLPVIYVPLNVPVVVGADYSCWCCATNTFVNDEDTTMITVIDE